MVIKKPTGPVPGVGIPLEWDSALKEPWHLAFENEPVNDVKWSCIVTEAVPAEAADDDCIQTYSQCVKSGLRKNIKIISMSDVVKAIKGSTSNIDIQKTKRDKPKAEKSDRAKIEKPDKIENGDRRSFKLPTPRFSQIVELAANYAVFTDTECKLPPDLMAAMIKYLILIVKEEHCLNKRKEAVQKRKMRENRLKAKFIRSLKPFEIREEERKSSLKVPSNILELTEPIDDHPLNGPDLYILLTDFYNVQIIPELIRINVPFLALLKVSILQAKQPGKWSLTFVPSRVDTNNKKVSGLIEFWENLMINCSNFEETKKFKDIIMMRYEAPYFKSPELRLDIMKKIFNELTWMQYSVYNIHRQHKIFLRELYVQPVVLSLQRLDLSTCKVYNKICDAVVTGESITPALVLFAMIEQVTVGVPETESVIPEYRYKFSDFAASESQLATPGNKSHKSSPEKPVEYTTPCYACKSKIRENICGKIKKAIVTEQSKSEKNEPSGIFEETSTVITQTEESLIEDFTINVQSSKESLISETLDKVLATKKFEKDKKDKNWKAPSLCFHGDRVLLQLYHCDSRILTPETIVSRFLKNCTVSQIWNKYPELPPADRAFFNFHFASLQKISEEQEESLKLKVHFAIIMKLIGIMKSYMYRGDDENHSEMFFFPDRMKKFSKVKFLQNPLGLKQEDKNISSYFFKTFRSGFIFPRENKQSSQSDQKSMKSLDSMSDADSLRKAIAHFNMALISHRSSGNFFPLAFKRFEMLNSDSGVSNYHTKALSNLFYVLDHPEISNLIEPHFLHDKEDYQKLIQGFTLYEKLEPHVMIQRLLEAEENYNTVQYYYFKPTDAVVALVMNDFDYRGIFFTYGTGVLPTPVSLRDFYNYVYEDILEWVAEEQNTYTKFISDLEEKMKAVEEKRDEEYLRRLRRKYCEMSPDEKEEFLETVINEQSEPEVAEEELEELPIKPKFYSPRKISFVTTDLIDLRVEINKKVNEFYSQDGTEVNVNIDNWLYNSSNLLTLIVKRPKLRLYYYSWLESENINTSFTLKTNSDMIFSFNKDCIEEEEEEENNFNYSVNISWPTGLLIQPVETISGLYIRQNYLDVYKNGWDIEEEKSRCYLQNGQVIIFKENCDFVILCASGTKYLFYESSRYEIITTTGEVLEVRTQGPCRNKKKLQSTQKIFIGIDPKTQETYYRREDGVNCMLWPNGRLITNYTDGTKITSTPYFDEEITTEWTIEEIIYFSEMESKPKPEIPELRSKTILRNSSGPKISESFTNEPFVLISCSYLMEHPKYATVSFNPGEPYTTLTMPEEVKVFIYPEGNYEIRMNRNIFTVKGTTVEFCLTCDSCDTKSVATLNLDDNEILCKFVDFFQKAFLVHRNGKTVFHESFDEADEDEIPLGSTNMAPSKTFFNNCIDEHTKNQGEHQRCFAFDRDLNGVEFVHENSFAFDCDKLPQDTYFDLQVDNQPNISHTFSSPYYKIGYENWTMEYEVKDDSLPTNLKKKDLKELGVKENPGNSFRYPFPKYHNFSYPIISFTTDKEVQMPKVTVVRIVKCLSPAPNQIIQNLQDYIAIYQKNAHDICTKMADVKSRDEPPLHTKFVKMRLKKIALTLNQTFNMYPHLCTQFPSTEKDIHYFGHFINLMEMFKSHTEEEQNILPDCRHIPQPLPRSNDFSTIKEEKE